MDLKSNNTETDQQFMVRFYESYKSFLFHSAKKYTQSQADCEDIIQDVMVRVMRNIPTLQRLSSNQVVTYLFLTVRSVCTDRKRSAQERIIPVSDDSLELLRHEQEGDRTQFAYDAKWDAQILKKALSAKDWGLLEAKYILGYSDEEIARDLGCAPDSVRTLLRRARCRAKTVLENGKEGDGR